MKLLIFKKHIFSNPCCCDFFNSIGIAPGFITLFNRINDKCLQINRKIPNAENRNFSIQ